MRIRLQGIRFAYQDREVLSGIDLEVERGEILALLGPNGCGKTTVLRHVAGVLGPSAGKVYLDLEELGRLRPRELARRLGVVEQDRHVGFAFRVEELVTLGRLPHMGRFGRGGPADRTAVARAMQLTGVTPLAQRPIDALSGGERQRVFLAMALAQAPDVLLLDEPTAHLDVQHQLEFLSLVRHRAREGLTVLMALHDVNLAATFADRIGLMGRGVLLAAGHPREVLTPEALKAAFGVNCVVGTSPATGATYVHFAPPAAAHPRKGRILVIGGGGAAAQLLPSLSEQHEVCLGVVAPLDTDYQVASQLGIPVIAEAPFSPVSQQALDELGRAISKAEAIIVAPVWVGPGNLPVIATLAACADPAKIRIVDQEGISERDFTGGEATRLLRELLAAGARPTREADVVSREPNAG